MFGPDDVTKRFAFFLALVLLLAAISYVNFNVTGDLFSQIFFAIFTALALYFGFKLASPRQEGQKDLRHGILKYASAIFIGVVQFYQKDLLKIFKTVSRGTESTLGFSNASDAIRETEVISFLAFVLVISAFVVLAFILLRGSTSAPPMGQPAQRIADVLPPVTNLERVKNLKQSLAERLARIDASARWSDANFVPLQAEVQVLEGRYSRLKIIDLLSALRENQKTSIFVILGEPGSGKSVAMRKLARDLMNVDNLSSRIPVYINLKEWRPDRQWSFDDPPTVTEFSTFIVNTILDGIDYNSQFFLRQKDSSTDRSIFDELHEAGYFFYILDSFDEIPAVLDLDENSWLIGRLSETIANFVTGGRRSRGVIASRLFRKPKILHSQRSIFQIRPFSDDSMIRAIEAAAQNPTRLVQIILGERPDLGSIARNPFLLNLIISYFNVQREAPPSQARMFDVYLSENIKLGRQLYRLIGVEDAKILDICGQIALLMFGTPNVGLELTENKITEEISDRELPKIITFLTQSRIGRLGGDTRSFSFAHRRFTEFFLVDRIRHRQIQIPFDAIEADSRWRDALVLYAEIAPVADAGMLSERAWYFARRLPDLQLTGQREAFVESRHALRFLIEGFRTRRELIPHLQGDISRLIYSKLSVEHDFLEMKTVLEAISLLDDRLSYKIILYVLARLPPWLAETAATSARYLRSVNLPLALAIYGSCIRRATLYGSKEIRRQRDVLLVSSATHQVANWLWWNLFDRYRLYAGLAGTMLIGLWNNDYLSITMLMLALAIYGALPFMLSLMTLGGTLPTSSRRLRSRRKHAWNVVLGGNFGPAALAAVSLYLMSLTALLQLSGVRYGLPLPKSPTMTWLMLIIVGCSCLPTAKPSWIQIYKITRRFSKSFVSMFTLQRENYYVLGVLAAIYAAFGGIIYLITMLGIGDYAIGFIVAIVILLAMFLVYRVTKAVKADFVLLRKSRSHFDPSKLSIAETFLSFRTHHYREKYVDWLEENAIEHHEQLADPQNIWSPAGRPQLPNDRSSLRLAQLDGRWTGFE